MDEKTIDIFIHAKIIKYFFIKQAKNLENFTLYVEINSNK
jgi:hypothetical protein